MCTNCCESISYQPDLSMTSYPLACCQPTPREPLFPVSQQYPSNRRTVVKIPKKYVNSTLASMSKPPKKRVDKCPAQSSEETCCKPARNTVKNKRVSHSPCMSSGETGDRGNQRKSTKKKCVAAKASEDTCKSFETRGSKKKSQVECVDSSEEADDGCDDNFTDPSCDMMCDDSKVFSDSCGDAKTNKSSKSSFKSKTNTMNSAEKNCSNYMYDNPELRQSKAKKSCADSCVDLDNYGSDFEVWLLQCPKDFDPKKIMNCKLGKADRSSMSGVECSADRYCTKKTLAVIAPEKAAEYEMFCDNIKLIKPVGKIVVCESSDPKSSSQNFDMDCPSENVNSCDSDNDSEVDECASSEPDEELCPPPPPTCKKSKKSSIDQQCCSEPEEDSCKTPLAGKKLKKKLDDQRFTIETTVTVEKCANDRKKSMCASKSRYLPLDPPEPEPQTSKKKKKSTKGADSSWLKDC